LSLLIVEQWWLIAPVAAAIIEVGAEIAKFW